MDEPVASVICCYNNDEILNKMLLKSFLEQTGKYEFIPIDNRGSKFASAAQALNYGASIAKGKYLIFAHQDVMLSSTTIPPSRRNCAGVRP